MENGEWRISRSNRTGNQHLLPPFSQHSAEFFAAAMFKPSEMIRRKWCRLRLGLYNGPIGKLLASPFGYS